MNVRSRHSPAWLRSGSCVQDVYYKSPVRRFRFHFVNAQKETITCCLSRLKQMIFEMMTWQVRRQRVKACGFEFYHILFFYFSFPPCHSSIPPPHIHSRGSEYACVVVHAHMSASCRARNATLFVFDCLCPPTCQLIMPTPALFITSLNSMGAWLREKQER